MFNACVDAGGNFVDSADVYSSGRSEDMLGGFIAERSLRERIVLATKAGFARETGASAPDPVYPYSIFTPEVRRLRRCVGRGAASLRPAFSNRRAARSRRLPAQVFTIADGGMTIGSTRSITHVSTSWRRPNRPISAIRSMLGSA